MTAPLGKTFIMLLLAALPAMAPAETINGIAAIVNGDPITTYEVDREAALLAKNSDKKAGPTIGQAQNRSTALNMLIEKKLIEQKIKELDIKISDDEVRAAIEDVKRQNKLTQDALVAALNAQGLTFEQYKTQIREQLERLRLMSQEVRSKVQVGEKEIKEYYDANYRKYSDETFQARHIFFKIGPEAPDSDRKKITATASAVLQEIRSGKDFAELAKKYSDDASTAKEGGDLGSFKRGEMLPDIENVLDAMKPGDVSDLVKTPAGIHIIKLENKTVKNVRTLDEVKGEIEDTLYKKKSEERFKQWSADLKKDASIEIR